MPPCPAVSSPSIPGQSQARAPPAQPQKPTGEGHSDASKLTCHQCSKQFDTKPLLFSQQVRSIRSHISVCVGIDSPSSHLHYYFVITNCRTWEFHMMMMRLMITSYRRVGFRCSAVKPAVSSIKPRKMSSQCVSTVNRRRSTLTPSATTNRTWTSVVKVSKQDCCPTSSFLYCFQVFQRLSGDDCCLLKRKTAVYRMLIDLVMKRFKIIIIKIASNARNVTLLHIIINDIMPHPSCVPGCKLLFRHDLNSRNKDHPWRPCSYCSGISQKMLHSHYGGQMEEFCRPHCMSQYTVLYYGVRRLTVCSICFSYVQTISPSCLFNTCHFSPPSFSLVQMGRCDSCRKQGHMAERLQCLGSVRNFCNLPCLLQYCYLHFETSQHTSSNGTGTAPQTPNGNLCHISVTWPWSVLTAKNLIQVKIVMQSVEMWFDSVPVIVWKLLSSSNTAAFQVQKSAFGCQSYQVWSLLSLFFQLQPSPTIRPRWILS